MISNKFVFPRIGFTLAEVLMTLTIVGVLAALTIPSLIASIDDIEYKVALKKQFSDANSVLHKVAMDRGGLLVGYTSVTGNSDTHANDFKNMLLPYVNHVKHCDCNEGNDGISQGCKLDATEAFRYDGSDYLYPGFPWEEYHYATIVLSNGAIWYFYGYQESLGTCTNGWINAGPYKNQNCAIMRIDTNGLKGPNRTTKDIFEFFIASNGVLIPHGSIYDGWKNSVSVAHGYNPTLVEMLSGQ